MASIFVFYTSKSGWVFMNGVELENGAGDVIQKKFKNVIRDTLARGYISESGVYVAQDFDFDPYSKPQYYYSDLRAFLDVGNIKGRPLCKKSVMYSVPVEIINN